MPFTAKDHPRFEEVNAIYQRQADSTLSNNVSAIRGLHARGFVSIPLNGRKSNEDQWARSVQRDIDLHSYATVIYELEKITEDGEFLTVYSTRRCSGTNDKGKRFNTEVRIKDDFQKAREGNWLMTRSETISRDLWLNGIHLSLEQMPGVLELEQGCTDGG